MGIAGMVYLNDNCCLISAFEQNEREHQDLIEAVRNLRAVRPVLLQFLNMH